jgi:predicted MFS family arabinose efflux permease
MSAIDVRFVSAGAIVGGVFATLLAGTSLGFIPGWRLAFFALAIVSVLLGLAVFFFATDPRAPSQYATIG